MAASRFQTIYTDDFLGQNENQNTLKSHLTLFKEFMVERHQESREIHLIPPADLNRYLSESRKENPRKLTQLSSRSHPRHLVGKRTAQKDINIDTTSDSQVNSNFPNRWTPAGLTFNNYFYLFLYLYIT